MDITTKRWATDLRGKHWLRNCVYKWFMVGILNKANKSNKRNDTTATPKVKKLTNTNHTNERKSD